MLKALGEMGVLGVAVPVEYGGGGMDYVSYAMIVSEISRGCGGTGTIVAAHNSLYCYPTAEFGNEEPKAKISHPMRIGESIGCYALTEADAGSDPASMRTTARLDGDTWVINGEKKFITSGNIADYCVFAASTDRSKGYKGITHLSAICVRLPASKLAEWKKKLGINASGTAELVFEDARIPKENILGEPGSGLRQMLETLDSGRISIASKALGIGRAVLEEATAYARERTQFGKPSGNSRQSSGSSRTWRPNWTLRNSSSGVQPGLRTAGCRLKKGRDGQAVCFGYRDARGHRRRAILGGYGYCKDYPMERHMRDVKITQIYEGTTKIQRLVIARNILGKRK